jgi:16S rRNA (cytidine1402-2'-O)-methyltransferase
MTKGKLYLLPIVIADDTEHLVIAPQVKEVISNLDYFLVENVRTARRYISKLRLGLVIEDLQFEVLDKSTTEAQVDQLMHVVIKGCDVGVMSESGCPGIADPGSAAVSKAHQLGIQVIPLSGPSSILMALMASGFNGQSFVFHGYIPIDKTELAQKIKSMESDARKLNQTQVFMDTPYRNQKLYEELIVHCQNDTLLSIACGITGQNEMIKTLKISAWRKQSVDVHKIPTIFSIYV